MAEFRDLSGMGENILNSFNQGRERRREDDARKYYGQAAQGNTDALKSLFGVAPQQAMQLQTQQKTQAKADQEEISTLVWKGASAIKAAPPQVKPQVYAMVREQLAKHSGAQEWLSHLPPQYDPASAAAIDPVIEGIIARAGMYQPSTSADRAPAGLRQFEAMAANAGLVPGTPAYQQAAQIYLGQEARARNQVYESADGANVINMGGGQRPTAAPVMMAPPEIVPSGVDQSVMGTGQQLVNDDGSMIPNPDFDTLNAVEKSKMASYTKAGVPFHVLNGKVIAGNTQAASQQLKPPPKAGAGVYAQLSAQEVAALGLPVGTVAQRNTNGKIDIVSKPEKAGGAAKPLPVAAVKLMEEAQDSLAAAEGINQLLADYGSRIKRGDLKLGLLTNMEAKARNYTGQSDKNSRNFASLQASLEKMRNQSLMLNKGVQTDGDAQRAWNELMANINDQKVVEQRLAEIQKLNVRAAQLQREKIARIKKNYSGAQETAAPDLSGLSDEELLQALQ